MHKQSLRPALQYIQTSHSPRLPRSSKYLKKLDDLDQLVICTVNRLPKTRNLDHSVGPKTKRKICGQKRKWLRLPLPPLLPESVVPQARGGGSTAACTTDALQTIMVFHLHAACAEGSLQTSKAAHTVHASQRETTGPWLEQINKPSNHSKNKQYRTRRRVGGARGDVTAAACLWLVICADHAKQHGQQPLWLVININQSQSEVANAKRVIATNKRIQWMKTHCNSACPLLNTPRTDTRWLRLNKGVYLNAQGRFQKPCSLIPNKH